MPVIALRGSKANAQGAATAIATTKLQALSIAKQRKAEANYWAAKQGFQFGVPSGAFSSAIESVKEQEAAGSDRQLAAGDLATPFWSPLGPSPIDLYTYFAPGVVFGSAHTGAGRFTAIAVDPQSGDIVAGAANGGVYLSTDGQTFSQIFNGQGTMAIGAIAIASTRWLIIASAI